MCSASSKVSFRKEETRRHQKRKRWRKREDGDRRRHDLNPSTSIVGDDVGGDGDEVDGETGTLMVSRRSFRRRERNRTVNVTSAKSQKVACQGVSSSGVFPAFSSL